MTQVPASSHGGGTSFANWTVDANGNWSVHPPTTSGAGGPIEDLRTAELASDTTDVFRVFSLDKNAALFTIDSSGETDLFLRDSGGAGFSVQELQAGGQPLLVAASQAARAGRFVAQFGNGTDGLFRFGNGGLIVSALNAAPADGDLSAGDVALWYDATNGASKLMVKAKQADGTVKTAAVALA